MRWRAGRKYKMKNRPEGRFFCDYLCGAIVLPAALSFSALSEKIGEKRSGELRLAHAAGTGSGKSCFSVVIKAQVSPPDAKVHTACRLPPLSLLRADNSPHLTAVRSAEAVPDDPAADSLDRADAGADSSSDQYRCKKFHSDVSFIPRGSAAP